MSRTAKSVFRENHRLKTHPEPSQAVWDGIKTYEVRVNDRAYKVGDQLLLEEYDAEANTYSGRDILVSVTYMTPGGKWGLPDKLCVLGIQILIRTPQLQANLHG